MTHSPQSFGGYQRRLQGEETIELRLLLLPAVDVGLRAVIPILLLVVAFPVPLVEEVTGDPDADYDEESQT